MCTHENEIDNRAKRALVSRRGGMTALAAVRIKIDELKLACQRECGTASPWHGEEIDVLDPAAAAEQAAAHTWSGIVRDDLAEIRERCRSVVNRVFRRRSQDDRMRRTS